MNTAVTVRRSGDRLLAWVATLSGVLTALTFVASRFAARPEGAGVMLPRVRRGPENTGQLLQFLNVGSFIWYGCFLSAPLFVLLSRRFPFDRKRWISSSAMHVLVIELLAVVIALLQHRFTYGATSMAPDLWPYVKVGMITSTLPLLTVAAAAHALEARFRAQERDLEAERIRSQLAESRLESLTAQLQPHFLFNTLQGISTLISRDPVAADRMLTSLSDLLREVLRREDKREIELTEELRVLDLYLDISRSRFGDRLEVTVDAEPDTQQALVPFFILQPLVENAMHHGISSHAGRGAIDISVARLGDRLLLTVADDGPGVVTPDEHRGIGLANTKARLEELYRGNYSFEFGRPPYGGFRVVVSIPFRVKSAATAVQGAK